MPLDQIPRETELAFTLLESRDKCEGHRIFQQSDPNTHRLVSTYFDTPTGVLGRAGWSVRIRRSDVGFTQTVKGPTFAASRSEMEIKIDPPADRLDFNQIRLTPIWQMIDGKIDDLRPIFETDIKRTTRYLHLPSATIEAAFDEGNLLGFCTERRAAINDLELEIKSGDVGSLFRVAVELALDTPIMMEAESKAGRGYRLINGEEPSAVKHDEIVIDKSAKTADCFRLIIGEIIDHLRRNLAAAYAGRVEGVHQIRVALRRLRAALVFFKKMLHKETVAAFDKKLQYFGHVFGEARDWDVFLTSTLNEAKKELPDVGWLNLVYQAAVAKQADSHAAVRRELESRTFNSLILSMMGWTDDHPSNILIGLDSSDRPALDVIPHLLSDLARKVADRQRKLNGSPHRLHDLRKSTKKLRYACEFTESLYPNKQVKRFLGPCKDIQETLGAINDVAMTHNLMAVLVADRPALAPAMGELSRWLKHRKTKAEKQIPKLLRRLHKDQPFWTN